MMISSIFITKDTCCQNGVRRRTRKAKPFATKQRQGAANMEWYAQIGWTAILSIFTLYYIATRFFTASGENGVAAREENDETNNSGTERQENVEAKPIQHADSEKMFKCDVSS